MIGKRMICIVLSFVFAFVSTVAAAAQPMHPKKKRTINRRFDPVEVDGKYLDGFLGKPVGNMRLFAYRSGVMAPDRKRGGGRSGQEVDAESSEDNRVGQPEPVVELDPPRAGGALIPPRPQHDRGHGHEHSGATRGDGPRHQGVGTWARMPSRT